MVLLHRLFGELHECFHHRKPVVRSKEILAICTWRFDNGETLLRIDSNRRCHTWRVILYLFNPILRKISLSWFNRWIFTNILSKQHNKSIETKIDEIRVIYITIVNRICKCVHINKQRLPVYPFLQFVCFTCNAWSFCFTVREEIAFRCNFPMFIPSPFPLNKNKKNQK